MGNIKGVRKQISSIQNTQKITRAMEMVAASKMKRAQENMEKTRPYATRICEVLGHVAKAHPEYRHEYLAQREIRQRVGYIIVSTDRGLCGGLNVNMFKVVAKQIADYLAQGIEVDVCLIGRKAQAFFSRFGVNVIAQTSSLGDNPAVADIIGVVRSMLQRYDANELDAVFVGYNAFVNTMSQKPETAQLLPIVPSEETSLNHHWDYIYEPESKALLDLLFTRYIESQVYQSLVENIACEQAARMVAMKSATDNAGDIIKNLQLEYNKARQAAITQEISEIVGGAAAIE